MEINEFLALVGVAYRGFWSTGSTTAVLGEEFSVVTQQIPRRKGTDPHSQAHLPLLVASSWMVLLL